VKTVSDLTIRAKMIGGDVPSVWKFGT